MKTVFKLTHKVAAFKAKLELWGRRVNRGILDMFYTLARILGQPEPLFSQLVHDHLSLLLTQFERYFPTTKTHELVMNGSATHLSTNQANLACLCKKKINCWRLQMKAALKLRLKQQLCRCSGLKWDRGDGGYPDMGDTLRSQPQHLKPCCHFRHPICVKQSFLLLQPTKQITE